LTQLTLAPAFPLDAHIRKVTINGRAAEFSLKEIGDRQFAEVFINNGLASNEIVFTYDEGTDLIIEREELRLGASNQGLRVLRSRVEEDVLHLTLEGLGGRSYSLKMLVPHAPIEKEKPSAKEKASAKVVEKRELRQLKISFEGAAGAYVRRELEIPLRPEK
jgi:hypothetical protein